MIRYRSKDGFTLVELMTAIVAGSLVTLAALTLLLLGVRINRHSNDTIIDRNNVDIVLNALEKIATEGGVSKVETTPDSWVVKGKPDGVNETVLFSYDAQTRAIYTGEYKEENSLAIPLLENVLASFVNINDAGNLLTFSVETKDGSYNTSAYCRTSTYERQKEVYEEVLDKEPEADAGETDEEARLAFLKYLTSQHRLAGGSPNPGLVLDKDGYSTGWYYSQWYIGTDLNEEWNAETPWCACYVSWALSQVTGEFNEKDAVGESKYIAEPIGRQQPYYDDPNDPTKVRYEPHWFASVDWFRDALLDTEEGKNKGNEWKRSYGYSRESAEQDDYIPKPGDIVFIDWERDGDPDHVGVVVMLEDKPGWETSPAMDRPDRYEYVYTIEGNSAGIVAVRRYAFDDKIINGYGVINWTKTDPNRQPQTDSEQTEP